MADLLILGLIVVYIGGSWKFWTGYEQTNFSRRLPTRLLLTSLWPVLILSNSSYRRNFRKALKGRIHY